MKRKYFLVILFLILAIFLSGCCLFENLSADVVITKWEQDYSGGKWSDQVKVYYTITNTGNVDIYYYQIWFKAYCKDGSYYEDWTSGLWVYVGHPETDYTFINVPDKEVVSVEVTGWELDSFVIPYS